ncbi:TonB-dependent receptor [Montanilutibacter psychrotolerans]|uniref:TonB-dependent receptor n=1 Tax=Montanilutibacter psychrotolerans TaxID=1327343 RepID=A0A3M8T3K8_9GAMM|nr:TonB-dependent receptor [Lysobacter psychrotolerans]RNF85282.1 TonB-dependent receptor [Lysobacter psychrotolerans]
MPARPRSAHSLPRHGLAVAIALLLPLHAALAQDAVPQAEPAQAEAKTLDTMLVTAQRRVEKAKDVPMALTLIKPEKLHVLGSGGSDVRFLSGRLPSLNIESSFGRAFPRFYVRGLGNTDFDLNASQPVSLVYDDVVQENPLLKGFPMFDVETVELLRGPQGSLFGRNTPAGVVKLESAKPTREFEGYGQVAYGNLGTTNVEGAVGGPLGQNWSARASVLYQRRDEWVDNTNPNARTNPKLEGYDETAARVQLQYDGSETFNALFNVHARHLNGTARLFRANLFKPGTNDLRDDFDIERVAIDGRNEQQLDTFGVGARLSWDFGNDLTLYSITGYETAESYSRGDIDGGVGAVFLPGGSNPGPIPFPAESADGLPDHRQLSQEFRLESNYAGPLNWQAGLFWFDEDITVDSFNYDTLAGGVQAGWAQQKQRNKAWAVYGSLDYAFSDKFKLRGGLRYTQDEKDFSASVLQSAPFGAPVSGPFLVNTDVDNVSWDLSGTYAATDDINLYARVATGFRAPSVQGRLLFQVPPQPSVADAEEVISYEAGIKADLWEQRARLGFAVFHYTVDNQQLNAVGGALNQTILLNADKTVGQGFELDLDAYLTDNLMVTFGASYNDTEIKDANLGVAPCGSGMCTVLDPVSGGLAFIDGNPLPQAPKWIYNVTARWSMPVGDNGEFYVYTDWAYRSEVNFFLYEATEFRSKDLLEGGLRVGYSWDNGNYDVALFGRNILDEVQAVGAIDFNNLTGFVNEPRVYGVEFRVGF